MVSASLRVSRWRCRVRNEGAVLRAMRRLTGLRTAVIGGTALVMLLTGCAGAAEAPAPPPAEPAAQGDADGAANETGDSANGASDDAAPDDAAGAAASSATVTIDGREFTFELQTCSVYDSGEALLSGLGGETGAGVPSYLDGDSTSFSDGEFRIDIGADGPFQSSDDFLSIGSSLGGAFALEETGDGYVVTGHAWGGDELDLGTGTIHFTCS